MKTSGPSKFFLCLCFMLCMGSLYAQKLSLDDMGLLCSKKNWEEVNYSLLNKGWVFYESKKGSNPRINASTWSYNKERYSDKAEAWLYLYTCDGIPERIDYNVFNQPAYDKIRKAISSAGFRFQSSNVEDDQVTTIYDNPRFVLEVVNAKTEKSDWSGASLTAYVFTLYKKAGFFDVNNGEKKVYNDNNVLVEEYVLKDGKADGPYKSYYPNGKISLKGYYRKGKADGNFTTWDENGNMTSEFSMANDSLEGKMKQYSNGRLSQEIMYRWGKKHGVATIYYENEGEYNLLETGEYRLDERSGLWQLIYLSDTGQIVLMAKHYSAGKLNGPSKEISGDTMILANYKDDLLDGEYRVFFDIQSMLFGGYCSQDTSGLVTLEHGHYRRGLKSGYWKYYSIGKQLMREGRYENGLETGIWLFYINRLELSASTYPYHGNTYIRCNYKAGKLDGKMEQFYRRIPVKKLCAEVGYTEHPLDTCIEYHVEKIYELSWYSGGELHGPFELRDSSDNILQQGQYNYGKRHGKWKIATALESGEGSPVSIYSEGSFVNGIMDGVWKDYHEEGKPLIETTYKNGRLHGERIFRNFSGEIFLWSSYKDDRLWTYVLLGSLTGDSLLRLDLRNHSSNSFECSRKEYFTNGSETIGYLVRFSGDFDYTDTESLIEEGLKDPLGTGIRVVLHGHYCDYDAQQRPVLEGVFEKGEKTGTWTEYFYDQKIKAQYEYSDNQCISEKYFCTDGRLYSGDLRLQEDGSDTYEIIQIRKGLRHGRSTTYSINSGKALRREKYKEGQKVKSWE